MSAIRQNFHTTSEAAINKQINMELYASYVYMGMSFHYQRDDVALDGVAKFMKDQSDEEREHAMKLMKYQNQRGGRVLLTRVEAPSMQEWNGAITGLEAALDLEKKVNESLLALHKLADSNNDPHLTDFLESEYLTEQVESIKQIADMITKLKRAGTTGLGEHIFDKELQ